jgi:hypothetical protein
MSTQRKRGGGAVCFEMKSLAKALFAAIVHVDSCAK